MPTPSQRQRRRREAGSEGSPRQNPAPRNTNRIGGEAIRMSRQNTAKSDTTKGSPGRCGGGRGKVVVLIRGGLSGGPKMPGHLQFAGWERTTGAVTPRCTGEKSAEAIVPAGMMRSREGPNVRAEGPLAFLWERR